MQLKSRLAQIVPPRLMHAYRIARYVRWSPFEPELEAVPRFVKKGTLALDIGANMGLYADVISQHAGQVVAFEPHPRCVAHLRQLALKRVRLVEAAASDIDGRTTLRTPIVGGYAEHGLSTIAPANTFSTSHSDGASGFDVRTARVDTVLDELGLSKQPISFAKIDVEGHELAVLRGMTETLARARPVLLIELESRHGGEVDGVFDLLTEIGYRAHAWRDGAPSPLSAEALAQMQSRDRFEEKQRDRQSDSYVYNVLFIPSAHQ